MAESTLAAKVANLDMGTPINGHEFLLLPLPHVEIKQEDLEGGPESDSQGGEARTAEVEWLTTECDLTADPQFESFLRALQQLSFSKVSLNMGNFLSFYNEAETGMHFFLSIMGPVTTVLNQLLVEAGNRAGINPTTLEGLTHCFQSTADRSATDNSSRYWHRMYLCESYGKMIEYNEKLRRNREAPSDQKEPMEPYVGQDATVFVVEIKCPYSFSTAKAEASLKARLGRPPVPVDDPYADEVMTHLAEHRAKFKCDHAFVSTVNGTIGIEFVGQPGPAPVSESSASTDITSQTNDTPCQELRFFECRNYDDRRDPRVLLAFLGWKLAVKKGIL